jgi:CTD kinase subunit alpha
MSKSPPPFPKYPTINIPPRLATLDGDWHEFESKALRKENERKDKEARRQAQKEKDAVAKEKKRAPDGEVADRDAKRLQMGPPSVPASKAER